MSFTRVIDRCAADMRRHDLGNLPTRLHEQLRERRHAIFYFAGRTPFQTSPHADDDFEDAGIFFEELRRRIMEAIRPMIPVSFEFAHAVNSVETYLPAELVSSCEVGAVQNACAGKLLKRHRKQFRDDDPTAKLIVRHGVHSNNYTVANLAPAFDELGPLCVVGFRHG